MSSSTVCRCRWCNEKNPIYIKYHDEEWGVPDKNDTELFELFMLEPFQAGLSWEIVLNKREGFRRAFDGFNAKKIASYGEEKLAEFALDKSIIRNKRKLGATVKNAAVFLEICKQYGSFSNYIRSFYAGFPIVEWDKTTSSLSDEISADLVRRGCSFMGSTVVYSLLQAAGKGNTASEISPMQLDREYDAMTKEGPNSSAAYTPVDALILLWDKYPTMHAYLLEKYEKVLNPDYSFE